MNDIKSPKLAILAMASALLAGCFDDGDDKGSGPGGETGACVSGDTVALQITEDCTLEEDETYILNGLTFVNPGVTLTIEPGVRITGGPNLATTPALVVQAGAYLKAVGTKEKPIVFTSHDSQNPARGDFGGVVLLGKAGINFAGGTTDIEGIQGMTYGGADDADSSGEMRYVRIEYAGFQLAPNNEINGLTLGGVGSRTSISHVQVFEALDDCFEWFGGTVSAKYLACTGVDDDMFDWDAGWRGSLQFALGVADSSTNTDANGIEADNLDKNEENAPRSNPTVSNITLIGNGAKSLNGMRLRRGTAAAITNAIVTGFSAGSAVFVDGAVSTRLAAKDSLTGKGIYAYGNGRMLRVNAAGSADSAAAAAKIPAWLTADSASLGLSRTTLRPATAPAGAVGVPAGLETAAYLGAFDPAAALWTEGWTRGL